MILHETLHGYQNGHKLLASSAKLSDTAQHKMLILSDSSGNRLDPRFQTYVTGYPLESDGYYVFARTWYAPENKRPGCVWTHSLLVPTLGLIEPSLSLIALNGLFRRPSEPYNSYSMPIDFDPRETEPLLDKYAVSAAKADVLSWCLERVYSKRHACAFIIGENSLEFETLPLLMWDQQWPSLRSQFSFCTGVLGSRSNDGRRMDLEIITRAHRSAAEH